MPNTKKKKKSTCSASVMVSLLFSSFLDPELLPRLMMMLISSLQTSPPGGHFPPCFDVLQLPVTQCRDWQCLLGWG